ncbi:YhcN/YlaJ family sporulation lipoprotein [Ectobacillus ponti]|uniref:YhcN/YlaJ family sporulation lipoprotein n=1 Tax=Ectobacillus ponti TaxID=2961894 RepID=A0AA42BP86_9BACI|nr:YhcN/YlaJ family sporulation lipoprotein [Ectobacillus ponti]MCP8967299.1 YhcN/YlaJ family sporulation lipoprotein [Ectobacillus ponti]
MNHKLKVLATSCLVFGALTACNTNKDSAMEIQRDRQIHQQQSENMTNRTDMMRNTSMQRARDTVPNTTYNGSSFARNTDRNGRDTVQVRNRDLMRDVSTNRGGSYTGKNATEHAADSDRTSYWGYTNFPRSYGYAGRPDVADIPYTDMSNVSVRGTDRTDRSEYRRITGRNGTSGVTGFYRTSGANPEYVNYGYTNGRYHGQDANDRTRSINMRTRDVNNNRGMNDLTGYGTAGTYGTVQTGYGAGAGAGVTGMGSYSAADRYSTPDVHNMNRVSYQNEQKTDHYGNVKYSKINQKIKQARRNNADAGYGYYGSQNYHGQTTDTSYPTRNVTMNGYNVNGDGAVTEKIENRVGRMNNVDRVAALTYGNDVLVAVKPAQDTSAATGTLEDDVRRTVAPYTNGRNVHVTVTKTMFDRVKSMSDRMQNGSMTNRMNKDMNDLFQTLRADYNKTNR